MKLESVSIANFRCYRDEICVEFDDLTTLVGKNDIGKSTVLEALEIFFNNDVVKIDPGDACIFGDDKKVVISCEFSDLPDSLVLDSEAETSLASEFLVAKNGRLKVRKTFDCKTKSPSEEICLIAYHPTADGVANLLDLKEKDLQGLVKARNLNVAQKGNPGMRQAIWAATNELKLDEVAIPMAKSKGDGARVWERLQAHLPLFALFQSDRNSKDSDDEVQTPMMAAIAEAISEVQSEIDAIQNRVRRKAEEIAKATHDALNTIDPGLARELTPQFVPPTSAKWKNLFSVNMETDQGIPLNKRGSGVRRLILVSFFKAAAERRMASEGMSRKVIYAIEEPETAQHPNNQRILIESFRALADDERCQVILTTHSPGFASELPTESIRYISRLKNGNPHIERGVDAFEKVAAALGVVPDSRVKILLCVEGPTDVQALKALSYALHVADPSLPDLRTDKRVAFVLLGGSTLQHWVSEHYLRRIGRREVHIYDGDVDKYAQSVNEVNRRQDGSWAVQTSKHEIENYLHSDAIFDAFGVTVGVPDFVDENGSGVPRLFSLAYHEFNKVGKPMGDDKAKKKLATMAFPKMTAARLSDRDPTGEVEGWFRRLAGMLAA